MHHRRHTGNGRSNQDGPGSALLGCSLIQLQHEHCRDDIRQRQGSCRPSDLQEGPHIGDDHGCDVRDRHDQDGGARVGTPMDLLALEHLLQQQLPQAERYDGGMAEEDDEVTGSYGHLSLAREGWAEDRSQGRRGERLEDVLCGVS